MLWFYNILKGLWGMKSRVWVLIFSLFMFLATSVMAQDVYSPYIAGANEIIFNQSMFTIDVVDPQASTNWKGINYPGLRGSNQLVVYTPAFGYRTNTNEFGTEAIVTGDTVTSLSGADSLIPANGLVISGHGHAKKWINENIMIGAKISIDLEKKTITSYITSDTFLYTARERIKEVQNMMLYYAQNSSAYNMKRTEQNISKAKDYIDKAQKDSENSQKYASRAIEYADLAMSTVIPYEASELKGVWLRPVKYTPDEIAKVVADLSNSGVNNIFLETYFHGKTIFPSQTMSKYGFIRQNEEFIGFDPLRVWINEAHKRGVKIHIWFETFYVGNKPPETNPEYILARRPDWANRQKKSANSPTISYSVSEHNGYFIDPANPEVQTFLYELLSEIVTRYKPDGINLDYIRYPQSLAVNYPTYELSNWGYTKIAREEFKNMYGVDPMDLRVSDPLWYQWKFYRCNKITNFVRKTSHLCRANNITLTAVIFPNRPVALDTKLQDWRNWSMNDFVDGFTPLFLTCDDKTASNLMDQVLRNKSASTKLYAGLFVTFMNGANSDLIKQIHAARKNCLSGFIIFDYAHLNDNYLNTLTESILKPVKKEVIISEYSQVQQTKDNKRGRRSRK